jgi:hypothetical protein
LASLSDERTVFSQIDRKYKLAIELEVMNPAGQQIMIVVPGDIQDQIVLLSRRRCCICFSLCGDVDLKAGQIAHLAKQAQLKFLKPVLQNRMKDVKSL